jgi:SAM-dependent MidA family methyltransferase
VIEVGPGSGQLARAILRLSRPPGLLRHLRPPPFTYHLVERSPILREQQRRLLGRTARWHQCVEDALTATDGHAFLFSNELIDAFPVRVFRCDGTVPDGTGPEAASWSELHLQLAARQLAETWLPSGTLPDSAVFSHQWPAGQRVEVHESAHDWLARWQTHWKSGELLTIDYGGHSPDLYRRAPAGTLRAYYHHERLTGPDVYTLAGRRDLTADVNFDDLQRWGDSLGLRTHSLITQRDFLFPHLDPDHSSVADRFLTDADGPGTSFKVLRQRKGNP